jgi:hypothetical protein
LICQLWSGDNPTLMITRLLHLFRLLLILCGGHRQLALENLALRQQLAVYKRTLPRPKLGTVDRLLWVWLARCPFRLTHPGVRRTGCGRSSGAPPKDTLRGPTCSVWSFRRQAKEAVEPR